MATIKKPSKSMAFQNEVSNDLEKAKLAISNGASLVKEVVRGVETYGVQYKEGGFFKITKTVYFQIF